MLKEKLKNKKRIIIIVFIFIILVIAGIIIVNNNKKTNETERTNQIYAEIVQSDEITFKRILDNDNEITIAKSGTRGYKEEKINGKIKKYIVIDGNTYYLDENNKTYYVYDNNDSILTEIEEILDSLETSHREKNIGKEIINSKSYDYEEFSSFQDFLVDTNRALKNESKAKTRFYYDNNKLVYIKTILDNEEELVKAEISHNKIDDSYFKIPSDYVNGEE